MKKGKNSYCKKTRRSELRRKQLSSMSKADLDAYRIKDAARKKKTVNPITPEPTEM